MNELTDPCFVGVDIGGTNIKSAAIDANGKLLSKDDQATVDELNNLLTTIDGMIHRCCEQAGRRVAAIGIASPGLAAADNSMITWMRGRLEVVEGIRWGQALAACRPTFVLNDAHSAAIGESWQRDLSNYRNVVMLTLGTGVGGGVIVDGRLLQGRRGRAGHLGHICLDPNGSPDIVGTPGSLEDLVGDHTVTQRSGGRFATTEQLVCAYSAGDPHARRVWERTVHNLACGIVSLVNVFDPDVVILGGGISNAGECLFGPLQSKLDEIEWRPTGEAVKIVAAQLGDMAGAIGAARFAMTQLTD